MAVTVTNLPRFDAIRGYPASYAFTYEVGGAPVVFDDWTATAVFWPITGDALLTVVPTFPDDGDVLIELDAEDTDLLPDPGRPGAWPVGRVEITLAGPDDTARFVASLVVSA